MKIIVPLVFLLLVACQHPKQIKPDNTQRNLFELDKQVDWSFTGKMSFSDGNEGGSGRVNWRSLNDLVTADLKAPLAQGSWSLSESQTGGKISSSKSEDKFGPSMGLLISQEVGWQVPWQQLKRWITVRPLNINKAEVIDLNKQKMVIKENGWVIEYSRFEELENKSLPHKIIARKAPYSIKLFIKSWKL